MEWNVQHLTTNKINSCGASAYRCIIRCSEQEAIKEVKCKYSGTKTINVIDALCKRGITSKRVSVFNDFICVKTHLDLLSDNWPIYIVAEYFSNSGRGRDSKSCHAISYYKRMIYDVLQPYEVDSSCYFHSFNKRLFIREIVIVGLFS